MTIFRKIPVHLLIIAFVALALLGVHCSNSTGPSAQEIIGVWNWVESVGGFAGSRITPQSTGMSEKLVFSLRGVFERYRDGRLEAQGRYWVERKRSTGGAEIDVLKIDGSSFEEIVRFSTRDTLILNEQCADCWEKKYVRVGEGY